VTHATPGLIEASPTAPPGAPPWWR